MAPLKEWLWDTPCARPANGSGGAKDQHPLSGSTVLPAVITGTHKKLRCQWESLSSELVVLQPINRLKAPTLPPLINPVGYKENFFFFEAKPGGSPWNKFSSRERVPYSLLSTIGLI